MDALSLSRSQIRGCWIMGEKGSQSGTGITKGGSDQFGAEGLILPTFSLNRSAG